MAVGNPFAKSQNFDFISNNKYLQDDFTGSTPLDFSNVSSSGIMSQAPIPQPLKYIPEGGGGGGGDDDGPPDPPGPKGPSGITGYDSLGNPISNDMSIGSAAKNAFSFFSNPIGFLGMRAYRAYKDKKEKQKLQDFYDAEKSAAAKTTQNMAAANKASNTGGYQAGYGDDFMDGGDRGSGNAPSDKGGSDTMGSHADGGRVGYFYGGLASIL